MSIYSPVPSAVPIPMSSFLAAPTGSISRRNQVSRERLTPSGEPLPRPASLQPSRWPGTLPTLGLHFPRSYPGVRATWPWSWPCMDKVDDATGPRSGETRLSCCPGTVKPTTQLGARRRSAGRGCRGGSTRQRRRGLMHRLRASTCRTLSPDCHGCTCALPSGAAAPRGGVPGRLSAHAVGAEGPQLQRQSGGTISAGLPQNGARATREASVRIWTSTPSSPRSSSGTSRRCAASRSSSAESASGRGRDGVVRGALVFRGALGHACARGRRRCPHAAFLAGRFGAYRAASDQVTTLLRELVAAGRAAEPGRGVRRSAAAPRPLDLPARGSAPGVSELKKGRSRRPRAG